MDIHNYIHTYMNIYIYIYIIYLFTYTPPPPWRPDPFSRQQEEAEEASDSDDNWSRWQRDRAHETRREMESWFEHRKKLYDSTMIDNTDNTSYFKRGGQKWDGVLIKCTSHIYIYTYVCVCIFWSPCQTTWNNMKHINLFCYLLIFGATACRVEPAETLRSLHLST